MSHGLLANPRTRGRRLALPWNAPANSNLAQPTTVDLAVLAETDPWAGRLEALAWAFVALGCLLRLGRYLLNFPFWGDELMLVQNYLDRDYANLVEPLTLQQVAPLGYLAIELTAIKLLGFSEWSLRLFAVVASLASVFLFRDLAARLLGKVPALLAVAIFSVSYYPVRHAAECKPYGSDLAAGLFLTWLAVRWLLAPRNRAWLWGLVAATPICLAVSYPAVFVAGGISLALAAPAWRTKDRQAQLAFVLYNAVLCGTFYSLLRVVAAGQYETTQRFMLDYWAGGFPPWQPWQLVSWLVSIHAGEMMAYPVGDDRFGSILTLICFVAGLAVLKCRGKRELLLLVLAPLALALVAAALRRYPYGGARLAQYYAPFACLSAGLGAAYLLSLLGTLPAKRRGLGAMLGVLLAIGGVMLAKDMAQPYKRLVDQEHRGFARWFWKENAAEGELLCVHADLQQNFYTDRVSEDYACYQRTYSPVHRRGARGATWDSLPPDRPVRCVMFHLEGERRDDAAFEKWLAAVQTHHELVAEQSYRVQLNAPREPDRYGRYIVYEFRAIPDNSVAQTAARTNPDAR